MPDRKEANKVDPSWQSAKVRGKPSSPAQWLLARGKVLCGPQTLDYGCGRGEDATFFKWDRYDPHFSPNKPTGKYNYIVCIYVLNVVTPKVEKEIIKDILSMLAPRGVAYFAARRDAGMLHASPRGYKQRFVTLKFPKIKENKQYALYEVKKENGN